MNPLVYLCIFLGGAVGILLVLSYNRIKRRKFVACSLYGMQGLLVLMLLLATLLILSNLNTYQRLTYEKDIADVVISKVSEQSYQLELIYAEPSGATKVSKRYSISGDEWQLDSRIIKWKGWASIIGMDSYYRFDRLSGRYASVEQANTMLATAHQLTDTRNGISIWDLKRIMKSKLPFLDAYYGQSIYLPMKHGARFSVSISQAGLVVRPANEIASQTLENW
jgi:hypothetical protein